MGKTVISDDGRFEWDEEKNKLIVNFENFILKIPNL